eukprot:COSAG03_NODE_16523_length_399_cov_0.786667_1_plen_39_part_10
MLRTMIEAAGADNRHHVLSQTVPACCTRGEEERGDFGQQ